MFRQGLTFAAASVLALAGLNGSQLSLSHHGTAQISAMPGAVTAEFSLTANTGVLAVSPDGTATVYENPNSAVAVTVDRTGVATVSPVKHAATTEADSQALPTISTAAASGSSFGSTLVVLGPQHGAAVIPSLTNAGDAGQAAGSTKYLPVILVHGTWSDSATEFGPTLLPALEAAGIQAFTYDYGRIPWLPINLVRGADAGAEAPIQDSTLRLAQEISKVLAATGASQVNLIGASQGGLVIKNYLAQATDNAVANVVDINATNHGTTLNGPGKLLDPAIVDEAFAPIHSAITGVTQSLSNALKLTGPLRVVQGPVALAGATAQVVAGVAQEIAKIPVTVVQKIVRVALSPVIGPAGIQQAVGSEFLNRLNSTPDTKSGVNYLVLGSKNDTVATPYRSTFLNAAPGSAVINIEEHSLSGVKSTDVINHVDTPPPVVDAIVRFLTAADTHRDVDAMIDRSLGVTVTEDSGTTTVRSGADKIFYQGPSSDSSAIKRAIGQAVDTASPTRSTAQPAQASDTPALTDSRSLSVARTSAPATAGTLPPSRRPLTYIDTPAKATTKDTVQATRIETGDVRVPPDIPTAPDTKTQAQVKQQKHPNGRMFPASPAQKSSAATAMTDPSRHTAMTNTGKTTREANGAQSASAADDAGSHDADVATTKPNMAASRTNGAPGSPTGRIPSATHTPALSAHSPSTQSPAGSHSNKKSSDARAARDRNPRKSAA